MNPYDERAGEGHLMDAAPHAGPLCERAFTAWMKAQPPVIGSHGDRWLHAAFEAGWIMRGKSSGKWNEVWVDEAPTRRD